MAQDPAYWKERNDGSTKSPAMKVLALRTLEQMSLPSAQKTLDRTLTFPAHSLNGTDRGSLSGLVTQQLALATAKGV